MTSPTEGLHLVRRLADPGTLRGQVLAALLSLVQRLLAPGIVLAAAGRGAWLTAGAVLAFGVCALAQRVARAVLSSRVEARVYARAVQAALRGDVLQRSVLPDEEARAVLFEGMHVVVALLVTGLPNLAANSLAATAFAVLVVATQPAGVIAAVAVGCGLGAAWLLGSRRATARAWARLTPLWARLVDGVTDAFDGRVDIVVAGRAAAFAADYAETVRLWRAARSRSEFVVTFGGRLPLWVSAFAVGVGVLVPCLARGAPIGPALVTAALLASLAPAFAGVAQGLHDLLRHAPRVRAMDALLAVPGEDPRPTVALREPISRIELRDIHFAYRSRGGPERAALAGLSFSVDRGGLVALAGPNGSGKSTCLHTIVGTARPQAGGVWIDGVPLGELDVERWRRHVSFLPQRPYLAPRTRLRACLRFLDPDTSDARMTEALGRVGLAHVDLDASVDSLSVGQRQRVGLARVLCSDRPVVLLDEPDAGLDIAGLSLVTGLCRDLARVRTVLVAAHSQELLAAADRVILLEEGRVISERSRQLPGQK
ncbi:MAG: ATP-binding cassette domain-containing protein [Polyangiaceae bacterium]